MNWESKFSSIVQETEANLAKVKEKLRGKSSYSPKSLSFDDYSSSSRLSSLNQYPVSSTPKSHLTSDRYDSTLRSPRPSTLHLQEKVDQQTKTIDELTRLVHGFERERGEYQEQIRRLRNEVSQLSSQVLDSRSGPHLEWQMDQMKRNLTREVQEVRDQLKLFRSRVDTYTDHNASNSFNRDIDDVRLDIQEELQYVRKDLDVLRRRLGSVELGVKAAHHDRRYVERTQDRGTKSLRDMTSNRTQQLVDVLRMCPDATLSPANLQVDQLRSTVKHLKEKLDSVESRLHTSPVKPQPGSSRYSRTKQTFKSYDVDPLSDFDDDDDLDDDDDDDISVDLEDSDTDIDVSVTKMTKNRINTGRTRSVSPGLELTDDDDDDDIDAGSLNSVNVDDDDLDLEDLNIDDDDIDL